MSTCLLHRMIKYQQKRDRSCERVGRKQVRGGDIPPSNFVATNFCSLEKQRPPESTHLKRGNLTVAVNKERVKDDVSSKEKLGKKGEAHATEKRLLIEKSAGKANALDGGDGIRRRTST